MSAKVNRPGTAAAGGRRGAAGTAQGRAVPARVCAAALGLILLCAFAVVYSTHACRTLYAQLQELESAQWYLQEDYGRLLLEQSTWASHYRVETVARKELDMAPPALDQFRVVTP